MTYYLITLEWLQFENRMIMGTAALRAGNEKIEPSWVRLVQGQVEAMRFGVVQIVVHDSQVTQIEKTERVRLGKTRAQTIQNDLK